MCGIFGIINYGSNTYLKAQAYRDLTRALLEESQIRGSDASGLCVSNGSKISVFKDKLTASRLVKTQEYSDALKLITPDSSFQYMIGHTRARTKGDQAFNVNNHPIVANTVVGIHNGMIWNDDDLFSKYKGKIHRAGRVDSEIIFRLIDMYLKEEKSIVNSVKASSAEMAGSFACAFVTSMNPRYVTLFGAPIALHHIPVSETWVFASTDFILSSALDKVRCPALGNALVEEKLRVSNASGVRIDSITGKMFKFDIEHAEARHTSVGAWSNGDLYSERCPYDGIKTYCGNASCKECVYEQGIMYGGFC